MATSTLDRLIEEANETEDDLEALPQRMEELMTKWFAVSKIYEAHRQELVRLVQPLEDLLPNVAEYEAYAAPHDGKIAGPQWNMERFYTEAAKRLRIKSPGLVVVTQCNRSTAENRDILPELSDEQFNFYLDDVEMTANWWEKQPSVTPLDLAKSVIVHTVLENPALHDLVLQEAKRSVSDLTQLCFRLGFWRSDL